MRTLNIALLGYGKMGRTIAQLAPQRGFDVRLKLDIEENRDGSGINPENFRGIDVAIDFTTPAVVVENIRRVAALGCNLVVGTTGWGARLDEVRKVVESGGAGMVYAANFSIGVQLFYRLARAAAASFRDFAMYEPYVTEAHHSAKKDAPSGTALELQRVVESELSGRRVSVASVRAGYIPGTHELGFDSEADTVIIRHTARSRLGFAEGALYAARWVVGRKGLFTFEEALREKLPA
ncbi:MAG TPA: dihydrodipicolinate reductase C-terminal domain-containing protein [Terriglobia bacterium]|nr:dihydrodipicolinate reductase C-terminal domain-containing protein [Terriglobia bacterium]